jgi:hypothetical protein
MYELDCGEATQESLSKIYFEELKPIEVELIAGGLRVKPGADGPWKAGCSKPGPPFAGGCRGPQF